MVWIKVAGLTQGKPKFIPLPSLN